MKPKFLPYFLLFISFSTSLNSLLAQKNFAYAITGETSGDVNWTVVRQIDLTTGNLISNVYVPTLHKPLLLDALTGSKVNNVSIVQNKLAAENNVQVLNPSMAAAAAYDSKYNRLYFTTIMGNDLRYIDLNSNQLKIYYVRHQLLKPFKAQPGEADNITRMVFGYDGFGYALTNDGNHLIRFSTGKDVSITDLGGLKDGAKNGKVSVHTTFSSWGGDMVADVYNNLYLFTVKGLVFKINPRNLVADYIGEIKGLPENYTVNASAVDENGDIVISCATNSLNYFKVNLNTLEAIELAKNEGQVFNASDFANCNFAFQNEIDKQAIVAPDLKGNSFVTIYPNPAKGKNFTLLLNTAVNGAVTVELSDLAGKKIFNRVSNLSLKQTDKVYLPATTKSGLYVVRVLDAAGKSIYTNKLIVE
jgi:hypothetical protein